MKCEIDLLFIFRNPSTAYISYRQISLDAALPEPPSFLRFNVVRVNYCPGQQQITAKCESIRKLLLPLASALNGAKLEFDGRIDRNDLCDFSDHSMLLAHLGNDLLPLCIGLRAYEFRISFLSEQTAPNVISLILEMGPARNCANVKFVILGIDQPTALPVVRSQTGFLTALPKKDSVKIERRKHLKYEWKTFRMDRKYKLA